MAQEKIKKFIKKEENMMVDDIEELTFTRIKNRGKKKYDLMRVLEMMKDI